MKTFTVSEIPCALEEIGTGGPIILWPTYDLLGHNPKGEDGFDHLISCIRAIIPEGNCRIFAYQVSDWNGNLSPWPVDLEGDFSGGAPDTLTETLQPLISYLRTSFGADSIFYHMGYSMGGLFSLWLAYNTDIFRKIASCSGSLWYPGFLDYVNQSRLDSPMEIYLSLGGKEEKTRISYMQPVAENTREIYKVISKDSLCSRSELKWNSGGHFADSGKRLALAVRWLLENQ